MNSNIWKKFRRAVRDYRLVNTGDRIAVCVSGGKDSVLMAVCMKLLRREIDFHAEFIVMNPGYSEHNLDIIRSNLEKLDIPAEIISTNIFESVRNEKNPCFLCSRLRRGWLYRNAQEKGLNKIALGHHFDDAVETILMGMLYGSQMQAMLPKLKAEHYPVEVIRPLYRVRESSIIQWAEENNLHFIRCECGLENKSSKRAEIKEILCMLREKNPDVDMNIFRSAENVNLRKLLSYHIGDEYHSFMDD
ncbi:MAG: tRNA 2-thiocytidine biosynthesis protein TtcA [Ruminococcus flavefaciens]|nr:tRNA 2-thiocytidine biosynthesis protein TtcA [Ruminococcus flavefaciens]MCM1231227.1 tRNA 2-thiocytidine biosynthesis protein TtcA [Ruminococcus flavefaciens]